MLKEHIQTLVRQELKNQISESRIQESEEVIEEGFFNRLLATVAGANLGLSFGAYPGVIVLSQGLAAGSIGIAGVGSGLAIIGGLAGAAILGRKLYKMAVRGDPSEVDREYEILKDLTQQRDSLIIEVQDFPNKLEKLQRRIEMLTQQQIQQGHKLDKTLQREFDSGKMTDREKFNALTEVVQVAVEGRLTYLKQQNQLGLRGV
jgi:translation initiation factor 2B subunit (eIF-2B alpha/beta/delta family)